MLVLYALVLCLIHSVLANWPNEWLIGAACSQSALISFDKCNPEDYQCLCGSQNFLATVALCISERANTSSRTRDEAWDHFTLTTCEIHNAAASDRDYQEAMQYLNQTTVGSMPEDTGDDSASSGDSWNVDYPDIARPVHIPDDIYNVSMKSVYQFRHNKDIGVWQGSFLAGYWVFIILFVSLVRFKRWLEARFVGPHTNMKKPNAIYRLYQRHILLPATFGKRHMARLRFLGATFTIPTRFQTIVIGIYFLLHLIFDCVPYTFLEKDPLYPTHWKQMIRYVSDRSAIIGIIQLPLITLFAMRNNFVIWMTGWNYATFNTYHRAITRTMYAQFIVHSVTKHVFSVSYGGSLVKYFYPVPYYRWGVSAMFLMAIMIGAGHFRQNFYELFVRLHVPCAIGSYVCILYHLNGLGYKQTVYVSYGIWGVDWAIRFIRILFNNVQLWFPPRKQAGRLTRATVSLVGNNDCANVKVWTPVLWDAKPGQYVYIYFSRFRFWECHPFSVVGPADDESNSFQLFCRRRNGMTKRLVQKLLACQQMNRSVFIEGPYGVHSPVERYSNVLLIAGGVGVTGVLPYVEYLNSHPSAARKITFLWTVQTISDTDWVHDKLTQLFKDNFINIQIYVGKGFASSPIARYAEKSLTPPCVADRMRHRYAIARRSRDLTPMTERSSFSEAFGDHYRNLARVSINPNNQISGNDLSWPSSPEKDLTKRSDSTLVLSGTSTPSSPTIDGRDSPEVTDYNDSRVGLMEKESIPIGLESIPLEKTTEWYRHLKHGRPSLELTIEEFLADADGSACVLGCGPPTMMDVLRKSVCDNIDAAQQGRVDYFEEAYSW